AGEMVQICDRAGLERHVGRWEAASAAGEDSASLPVGYILTLEGADSIVTLEHLERAHADGLRALGPAHYGPGRYAYGTDASAPLNDQGRELLKAMDRLGMILDTTHLCDEAFWQAMEIFTGPVWASHCNCRALVDHNRQYSDAMLRAVIDRGGVIGMPLDAWMMVPGWIRGKTDPKEAGCDLSVMLDHLDHVCQVAGSAEHVGIGSDLDGGYGREQSPHDLETIADLASLPEMLAARGFPADDIEKVMRGNWLRFLRQAWAG
ncbi:MAG: membrane dipeptidase, partial [Planctomycetota bacterium]|nr:membrane dipeptidase [Planctomycetota bacterium]